MVSNQGRDAKTGRFGKAVLPKGVTPEMAEAIRKERKRAQNQKYYYRKQKEKLRSAGRLDKSLRNKIHGKLQDINRKVNALNSKLGIKPKSTWIPGQATKITSRGIENILPFWEAEELLKKGVMKDTEGKRYGKVYFEGREVLAGDISAMQEAWEEEIEDPLWASGQPTPYLIVIEDVINKTITFELDWT